MFQAARAEKNRCDTVVKSVEAALLTLSQATNTHVASTAAKASALASPALARISGAIGAEMHQVLIDSAADSKLREQIAKHNQGEASRRLAVHERELAACSKLFEYVKNELRVLAEKLGGKPAINESFDILGLDDHDLQLTVPFEDAQLRQMRVEVFKRAMQLHESFVVAAWQRMGANLGLFCDYQNGKFSTSQAGETARHLWDTFFLVVPVVSSTFASFDRLFSALGSQDIGTLLIDEAGQAAPQNAVGAIWRSCEVVAVGDPVQLEPVVPQQIQALTALRDWIGAHESWTPPNCSTQTLADAATPFGTSLKSAGLDDRTAWVGSPLRVHRRCLAPMFDAANEIAYAGLMVSAVENDTKSTDWLGPSDWYDVNGTAVGHWIKDQGDHVIQMIDRLLKTPQLNGKLKSAKGDWNVFVISPYRDVAWKFKAMLSTAFPREPGVSAMAGTVHTFQGKEADIVIFLLGGNPDKKGAVSFFAGSEASPNLLNVALTRAKKRFYVVGDKKLWVDNSATFRRMAEIFGSMRVST